LLVAQIVIVAVTALGRPLEVWDSWANWGVKARTIYLESYITPSLYTDASRAVTQLDYPLLVPLLEAWTYNWVGAPDDRLAGITSLLFYLALLGVCYSAVRSWGGSAALAFTAAVVVGTISNIAGLAAIVFAEVPLLTFASIAGVYLLKWLRGGSPGTLAIAAMGAGFMPWTKREGLIVLAALCLGAVVATFRSRRAWIGVGAFLLSAAALSGPWWALTALNSITNPAFGPLTLGTLHANLGRSAVITDLIWRSLTSPGFSYIWPLAALAALLLLLRSLRRKQRRADLTMVVIPVAVLLYIPMAASVYLFSSLVPFEQHVLASVDRLVKLVTPLVALWVALTGTTSDERPMTDDD
jgi:hypothetical protein